jgi:hypothetical protein
MGLYRLGCRSLMRFQSEYQNKLGKYQATLCLILYGAVLGFFV